MVVTLKSESECGMWSVFSFYQPFAVLTFDQFFGRGGGPLERQKQDNHVYRKTGTLSLIFREKIGDVTT